MRVIVTGSRTMSRVLAPLIEAELRLLPPGSTVVHGGCFTGADQFAGEIAKSLGLEVEVWRADWRAYGDAAGPIRNGKMVGAGADLVIAFWNGHSPGTRGCMKLARAAGIPVKVVKY